MANLRDIRRRITSVKSTQQITRAMKMVSAAKLRRAQTSMEAARPYAQKIAEVVASMAVRAEPGAHPLLQKPGAKEEKITLVVVSADRGLCGSFNGNVLRRGFDFRNEQREAEVSLVAVGRKAVDFFRHRQVPIVERYEDLFRGFDYSAAEKIGALLKQRYLDGEADAVYIVYNKFRSLLTQIPEVIRLLPVAPPEETGVPVGAIPFDFLYEPEPAEVLKALVERHVNTQIYQALLESSTGEHGARMTAMDSATTNAEEMIDSLTLFYNRARQANITRELIEVISGSDALGG